MSSKMNQRTYTDKATSSWRNISFSIAQITPLIPVSSSSGTTKLLVIDLVETSILIFRLTDFMLLSSFTRSFFALPDSCKNYNLIIINIHVQTATFNFQNTFNHKCLTPTFQVHLALIPNRSMCMCKSITPS